MNPSATHTFEARQLLAEALMTDAAALPADAALGVADGWDSLAHLRLVLGLEHRLGRALDAEEIVAIGGLDDVARLLATMA